MLKKTSVRVERMELGVLVHAYNSSPYEVEEGVGRYKASWGKQQDPS